MLLKEVTALKSSLIFATKDFSSALALDAYFAIKSYVSEQFEQLAIEKYIKEHVNDGMYKWDKKSHVNALTSH